MRPGAALLLFALLLAACDSTESRGDVATTAVRTPLSFQSAPAGPPSTPTNASGAGDCAAPTSAPLELSGVFCARDAGMERAVVLDIIDGDTLDVRLNDREERVRIFGIDTPERGDVCFREASDRLEELAADTVLMLPDVRDRDRSGRLLRYLYTPQGLSIDAVMITEGFARAWTRDGALRDPLVALEAFAARSGAGCLW